MPKVMFCGGIYNKAKRILPEVDKAIKGSGINHIVFLGDYVDEFNEGTKKIIDSTLFLADWVKARRSEGLMVNVLLGNHDLPYVVEPNDCTGHKGLQRTAVRQCGPLRGRRQWDLGFARA